MGVLSLKSSNERGPGAKPLAEDSCIAFHDGKINSQQEKFATKLYARVFWHTCSYAPG